MIGRSSTPVRIHPSCSDGGVTDDKEIPVQSALDPLFAAAPEALDGLQFSSLLRQLLPDLSRYARSLSRDPDLAQDLVQEAAIRAWRSRDRFMVGTNFKAWLYRILRNAFLSHVRRGRVARTDSYGDDLPEIPVAPAQENAVLLVEVKQNWQRLTPTQRRAIELVAIDGRSYEEAAEIENVSMGTIKSRVARGRQLLLALLEGNAQISATPSISKKVAVHDNADGSKTQSNCSLDIPPVRTIRTARKSNCYEHGGCNEQTCVPRLPETGLCGGKAANCKAYDDLIVL